MSLSVLEQRHEEEIVYSIARSHAETEKWIAASSVVHDERFSLVQSMLGAVILQGKREDAMDARINDLYAQEERLLEDCLCIAKDEALVRDAVYLEKQLAELTATTLLEMRASGVTDDDDDDDDKTVVEPDFGAQHECEHRAFPNYTRCLTCGNLMVPGLRASVADGFEKCLAATLARTKLKRTPERTAEIMQKVWVPYLRAVTPAVADAKDFVTVGRDFERPLSIGNTIVIWKDLFVGLVRPTYGCLIDTSVCGCNGECVCWRSKSSQSHQKKQKVSS